MPSTATGYKEAAAFSAETIVLDEGLRDYIRSAAQYLSANSATVAGDSAAAVAVRRAGGEPVVVILVDRRTAMLPSLDEVCVQFELTRREGEIALLLADRLSCREVAERLCLGVSTIRTHTEHILRKLNLKSKKDIRNVLLDQPRMSQMSQPARPSLRIVK